MNEMELNLEPTGEQKIVRPLEPLYSLLCTSPPESVAYLLATLNDFTDDKQLNDVYPEVGLTRREYIEQVLLVAGV
ncbi:MAG: hypothetical protein V3U76_06495 [Granulosicoccus sp.]